MSKKEREDSIDIDKGKDNTSNSISADSIYLKVLGISPQTKLLDFFLNNTDSDFSINEVVEKSKVSYPIAIKLIDSLLKQSLIIVTRKIGKASLLKINLQNSIIKHLLELPLLENKEEKDEN